MPDAPNAKIKPKWEDPPTSPTPCDLPYAELATTTNFSFLRGASHPDEMVYQAATLGYRAIAITDRNSLAGIVRAHEAAQHCKLPLIVGARLELRDAPDVLVWAPTLDAYARLSRLLTLGRRRAEKGECTLSLEDLAAHAEGLLAAVIEKEECPPFSGAFEKGDTPPFSMRLTRDPLGDLKNLFGPRLSLAAVAPHGSDDYSHLNSLLDLSRRFGIPLLATNDPHYHDPGRRPLHDVLTCVRHKCTLHDAGYKLFPNAERHLKTPAQMHRLFRDHPKAITRGLDVAAQCSFSLNQLTYQYPREFIPPVLTQSEYLAKLTWDGAARHYPQGIPDKVRAQVNEELAIIAQLHYEPYLLTIHELVDFARSRGILCQGRGSAANSAVCYCLGITSVDPATSQLLFARFISAARNEPPDIDVDFEHERREEVIQHVYEKYGRDRAGMTATLITYRGRSAVRDVGKALGMTPDAVDQLASQLDWWHGGSVDPDQVRAAGLDPNDRTVKLVMQLSQELLGFPRHLSQHTGGMVMSHTPLCDIVPIENASMADRTVIEWDKDDLDTLGLMKVDILALGMLTCISKSLSLLNQSRPDDTPPLELHTIPNDDPSVYDMICDADTVGVFQIESRAQMSMLPRLRPREYYDLVIEVAIVRPGPIQGDMVHPYLRRRNGEEPVEYPSEALRSVLQRTLGVPLFQEQAMSIAIVAAGFSPDEADQLRRAMAGWRRKGGLARFHQKLIDGMTSRGYEESFAERCFKQIEGFGEYGFPESHAASFARLVSVSCWIKRHHPATFAAALLNSQPMGFYAPPQIVRDAREHGVSVLPVDVNHSDWDCTLEPPSDVRPPARAKQTWGYSGPSLRLGFRQVKGLREAEARRIVAARTRAFTSVEDLFHRSLIAPSTIRLLADSDAFSSLELPRRTALWHALRLHRDDAPLFNLPSADLDRATLPAMPLPQEVRLDYAHTGLSLKRHPVALIRRRLRELDVLPACELARRNQGEWVKVAGLVLIRQRPGTAGGIVFQTLEDETGVANLIIQPSIFDHFRPAARHATLACAEGRLQSAHNVIHVMTYRITDLGYLLQGAWGKSRDFH